MSINTLFAVVCLAIVCHVDGHRFNTKYKQELEELAFSVEERFEEMNARFTSSLESLERDLDVQKKYCDFKRNGTCFWAVVHTRWDLSYQEAERKCQEVGGQLANIYTAGHYLMLQEHIRSLITHYNGVEMWLGMKIEPSTGEVTLTDGSDALYLSWYSSRDPSNNPRYTKMSFYVRPGPEAAVQGAATNEGMINYPTTVELSGFLCEI